MVAKIDSKAESIIIEKNALGMSCGEIAKILGVSKNAVNYHRIKLGLPIVSTGGRFSQITQDILDRLYTRHLLGATITELAKENGYGIPQLLNAFRRNGYKTRTVQETNSYPINMNCFESINDSSAYWLGFAITDGSNENFGKGRGLCVSLSSKDKLHLEKLKEFAEYQGPIYTRKVKRGFKVGVEYCTLRIGAAKMSADLSRWGVVPNKTFIAKAHDDLAFNRHFWRGAIDGDGWITRKKPVCVGLCGSKYLVNQFADYVCTLTGKRPVVNPDRNIYRTSFSGDTARSVLKELYSDCKYYLDRKMALAQMHINTVLQKQPKTENVIQDILRLRSAGFTSRQIGKKLNMSKATAMKYIKLHGMV